MEALGYFRRFEIASLVWISNTKGPGMDFKFCKK